jgi:2-dehydropantoate 2-reductase
VNERNRVILGRPDARPDKRIDALAAVLRAGGLEVEVTGRIRDAVWGKVLTNLIGGSLGVLTASATKNALADPALKAAASTMADEGAAIARAFGCDPGDPAAVPARLQSSIHKQSIVQDLELHRTMEIDALFRMPLELARLMNVPTPMLDVFVALAAQRARAAGLYPG